MDIWLCVATNGVVPCIGWKVTLLESMKKRCLFLEHAVNVTGVANVQVVCDRAEVFFMHFLTDASIFLYFLSTETSLTGQMSCLNANTNSPCYRAEFWTFAAVQRII